MKATTLTISTAFGATGNYAFSKGELLMLETAKERIELLKIGITGKTIERLYIANNNIKIIPAYNPIFFELVEMESCLPEKVKDNST